jgi:hypothetical protein
MPCYVPPSTISETEWLECMLCQAFKFLTKEQIFNIRGLDIYLDGMTWYLQHLAKDLQKAINLQNEKQKEKICEECDRLGIKYSFEDHVVITLGNYSVHV